MAHAKGAGAVLNPSPEAEPEAPSCWALQNRMRLHQKGRASRLKLPPRAEQEAQAARRGGLSHPKPKTKAKPKIKAKLPPNRSTPDTTMLRSAVSFSAFLGFTISVLLLSFHILP